MYVQKVYSQKGEKFFFLMFPMIGSYKPTLGKYQLRAVSSGRTCLSAKKDCPV